MAIMYLMATAQASAIENYLSFDAVLKACSEKTIVFGTDDKGHAVQIGENLDGYCRGVLEGSLATLAHSGYICLKDKQPTAEYLLSLILTYQNQSQSQEDDASVVIGAALKRAFRCDG